MGSRFLALVGAVVMLAGSAGATGPQDALLHKPAPQFVRRDLAGESVSLRAYRGRVVLLNFWATWCGPCQVELPRFAKWQKRFGAEGLQVIAVSMDDGDGPVRSLVAKLKPGYPVVMGADKLGTLYGGILGLPVTYLIGRDGKVAARYEGSSDLDAMERRIEELLRQGAR